MFEALWQNMIHKVRILADMSFTFEWDEERAAENLTKRGVRSEASTVFADPLSRTIPDPYIPKKKIDLLSSANQACRHLGCGAYLSW